MAFSSAEVALLLSSPETEFSWRLPLADPAGAAGGEQTQGRSSGLRHDSAVPWSALDLVPGCEVRCRTCRAVVVEQGKLAEWKDLPSENWAEMMEFWHCHKPDHHHHDADKNGVDSAGHGKATPTGLAARGYGASSTIAAQRGIGFVDLMAFAFAEEDCGVTVCLSRSSNSFYCFVCSLPCSVPSWSAVWVSRRRSSSLPWRDYRYKCPRVTRGSPAGLQHFSCFTRSEGWLLAGLGDQPRNFTQTCPRYGGVGIPRGTCMHRQIR